MNSLIRVGLAGAFVIAVTASFIAALPVSAAPACQPSTAVRYDRHPGATIVQTSFENGTLDKFLPSVSGTGSADASPGQHRSGGCSAHLHATADPGSVANVSAPALPAGSNEVYADGWFNVTTAGLSNNDVPYFRFFDGSVRVLDVFRDNRDGQVWLRVAGPDGAFDYTRLGRVARLGAWHHVVLHAAAGGTASTVEVWFDGQVLFSSNKVATGATALTRVQVGAEHARQMGDTYLDDVYITAR